MAPAENITEPCPICRVVRLTLTYRENADNPSKLCPECDNLISVELQPDGKLKLVAPHDPNYFDKSITECLKCPENHLRVWRAANGAIAKIYGAEIIATGNVVQCDKCQLVYDLP